MLERSSGVRNRRCYSAAYKSSYALLAIYVFHLPNMFATKENILTYIPSRSSKKKPYFEQWSQMDSIDLPEDDEQTPLIPSKPQSRHPHFRAISLTSLPTIHVPKLHNGFTVVNLLCAIVVVAASSTPFANIPLTRLIEDAFCRQHY